jgi:hypothetical protein
MSRRDGETDARGGGRRTDTLVVLGALLNRAIFEVYDLPKDRGAEI